MMERDIPQVTLGEPELFTRRRPSRRQGWVLLTILTVVTLGALLVAFPLTKGSPSEEPRPGPDPMAVGTSGTEPVAGATSGPNAEGDYALLPLRSSLQPNDIVAYMDRQPLYVIDPRPIEMNDRDMIVEDVANEESEASHYMIYVPAARAATDDAAQFYYLKVDQNRYLKVSLHGASS